MEAFVGRGFGFFDSGFILYILLGFGWRVGEMSFEILEVLW